MEVMDIKVGTIRQVHRVLVHNGYQVSENALRQWVRSGKVPSTHSGNTAYICYDTVVAYLTDYQALLA